MGIEQNKATLKRYYDEIFNGGDFSVWDELMDENYVTVTANGTEYKGLEGAKRRHASTSAAAPDGRTSIDEMVAEGDTVVIRGFTTGTNTGEFMGIPPTGKPYKAAFTAFYYFNNGRIVRGWALHDGMGRFQQLGVIPPVLVEAAAGNK